MRLLCGYLQCDAMKFRPAAQCSAELCCTPAPASQKTPTWLRATIQQIVNEVDRPRAGGLSVLERLTEVLSSSFCGIRSYRRRPDRSDGSRHWPILRSDDVSR